MKIKEENKSSGGHGLLLTSWKCNICHEPPEWLPSLCSCRTLKASLSWAGYLHNRAMHLSYCAHHIPHWLEFPINQTDSVSVKPLKCCVHQQHCAWWSIKSSFRLKGTSATSSKNSQRDFLLLVFTILDWLWLILPFSVLLYVSVDVLLVAVEIGPAPSGSSAWVA